MAKPRASTEPLAGEMDLALRKILPGHGLTPEHISTSPDFQKYMSRIMGQGAPLTGLRFDQALQGMKGDQLLRALAATRAMRGRTPVSGEMPPDSPEAAQSRGIKFTRAEEQRRAPEKPEADWEEALQGVGEDPRMYGVKAVPKLGEALRGTARGVRTRDFMTEKEAALEGLEPGSHRTFQGEVKAGKAKKPPRDFTGPGGLTADDYLTGKEPNRAGIAVNPQRFVPSHPEVETSSTARELDHALAMAVPGRSSAQHAYELLGLRASQSRLAPQFKALAKILSHDTLVEAAANPDYLDKMTAHRPYEGGSKQFRDPETWENRPVGSYTLGSAREERTGHAPPTPEQFDAVQEFMSALMPRLTKLNPAQEVAEKVPAYDPRPRYDLK